MPKMSNTQRDLILTAHKRPAKVTPYGSRGEIVLPSRLSSSGEALCRNGWAIRGNNGWLNVTTAGLIAAGIDIEALHAAAGHPVNKSGKPVTCDGCGAVLTTQPSQDQQQPGCSGDCCKVPA